MLRSTRNIVATFFILALSFLFLDFTGTLHSYLGWVAQVQFVPALLAHNFAIVSFLILLTVLLGRLFCSTVCPLGVCQDITSGLVSQVKKNRFSYKPTTTMALLIRYSMLGVYVVSFVSGITFVTVLLEPYSAFGRMVSSLISPLYMWGNNVLAFFAEKVGSYAFYTVDVWLKSVTALIVAIATFMVISLFAIKTGRGYCNLLCPVGAILGFISRFSLYKVRIDLSKCNSCKLCEQNCISSCLDISQGKIDYHRCMSCFTCIKKCAKGAIGYSMKRNINQNDELSTDGKTRRGIVSGLLLLIASLFATKKAHAYDFDGGVAPLLPKRKPLRHTPIVPAGADNLRVFRKNCTGCQLCVTVCKNNVLRPSYKLSEFMQPYMSFEKGYCRPECVKCSEVCPTGALIPITAEEKSATQIGVAVWNPDLCVVLSDGVRCDLCSVKCPTAAISMIDQDPNNTRLPKIPMIDNYRCIGCGACEHLCPARPYSAIHIEGLDTHRRV